MEIEMFSALGIVKKMRFLIEFLLVVIWCSSQIYASSAIGEIGKLFWEDQDLDKKIIENLTFELAEDQHKYRGESTEKYLLKDSEGNLWLFKTYLDPIHVKNDRVAYQLARIFGLTLPLICEINLPINEEQVYGSIQKIILDVESLRKDLIRCQIEDIQRYHILDWLISNYDAARDEFLIQKKSGRVITIDKDDAFSLEKVSSPGEDPDTWGNWYYKKFWENYANGKINVDFAKSFELIDHIQSVKNSLLKQVLKNSFDKVVSKWRIDQMVDSLIFKKKNLKIDFRKFYQKLAEKRREKIYVPTKKRINNYSKIVLRKMRKAVLQKRFYLKRLNSRNQNKQKNIEVVSSKKAWYMVDGLGYPRRGQFAPLATKTVYSLKELRKNILSPHEKLAISLYIEKVNQIRRENNWQGIGKEEPKRITKNPKYIKVSQIEYMLRISYGPFKKTISEYKNDVEKQPGSLWAHLNYILIPLDDPDREKRLKEYRKKLDSDPSNLIYQLAYGILADDSKCLMKIDDNFVWKYLALGCLENDAEKYKKVIALDSNKIATYWAHILLGDFFGPIGKEPNIEKAITNYKKALEIKPDSIEACLNLGSLYLIKRLPMKALKEFKEIKKLNPQYAKKHFHLENIKEVAKYKNERDYLEAVRMSTLSGEHHYIISLAYTVKKDYKNAEKHFDKAREFGYEVEVDLK